MDHRGPRIPHFCTLPSLRRLTATNAEAEISKLPLERFLTENHKKLLLFHPIPRASLVLRFSAIHMRAFSQWDSSLIGDRGSGMTIDPMSVVWHFDSDVDDFAVPEDEEIFNRFPSPDSWSSWGRRDGNLDYPEKLAASGVEELIHPGIEFSSEEQLATPQVDQDSRHAFQEWNACPIEHSDPQLDDIALINEADDIFFRSLFEDVTDIDGAESPSKCPRISVNLSGEWNHIQDSTNTNHTAEYCGPPDKFEEPGFGIYVAEEGTTKCDDIWNDISVEESVLMDLQRSTLQLSAKTRLCFRDSLYRLAENSSNHTKNSQNTKAARKNIKPASKGSLSRLQQSKSQEPVTNAIDRTVATLLFNIPASSAPYFPAGEPCHGNSQLYQPASSVSSSHPCGLPRRDAEVPTAAHQGQLLSFHHNPLSTTS